MERAENEEDPKAPTGADDIVLSDANANLRFDFRFLLVCRFPSPPFIDSINGTFCFDRAEPRALGITAASAT